MDVMDMQQMSLLSIIDENIRVLIFISITICIIFILLALVTLKLFNGYFVKVGRRRQGTDQINYDDVTRHESEIRHNNENAGRVATTSLGSTFDTTISGGGGSSHGAMAGVPVPAARWNNSLNVNNNINNSITNNLRPYPVAANIQQQQNNLNLCRNNKLRQQQNVSYGDDNGAIVTASAIISNITTLATMQQQQSLNEYNRFSGGGTGGVGPNSVANRQNYNNLNIVQPLPITAANNFDNQTLVIATTTTITASHQRENMNMREFPI
jgi:hypothetical protein